MEQAPYRVLLFYKYVDIDSPEEFAQEHVEFCKSNHLKGRILVATEGINGTVSGTYEDTQTYIDAMRADERFADMAFKIDESEGHAFKKMHVRPRPELVTLRLNEEDVDPRQTTGNYLTPEEWHEQLQNPDAIVLDARNKYEYDLGHFRGAIRPDIDSFKELPQWLKENKEKFEGKKILTYCTGGVRCEKFSGWLVDQGFDDVNQLHGGIVTYGKDPNVKGKMWDGQCYVFDERISVPVNQEEHVVVGRDYYTGEPCERYVNCANPECNKQIIVSEETERFYVGGCSDECRKHPRNRYVTRNNISVEEWDKQLQIIDEHLAATSNR
ncbi:rhodanese-related sulfurtransferase [Paenalkalicoccus suaedae]|uniref:tRNA uridine(34) hydroxylase n=1 Tax=Paenalkalicoccus suaedae TaxID=2592382 RepID=A0A859FHF8_9BACI|nr:rhodanese-related sulfurtransferase [Paenalkalicoccus suaedae]QKS71616.1 rhodanese-related sulfurtransferase [Paenalkalicoccus suaedae]